MSKASRLRTDFKVSIDHIKDRVITNLIEAKNQGRYKVEEKEIQKIVQVIESAFEQGFITVSGQIEKSIDESMR